MKYTHVRTVTVVRDRVCTLDSGSCVRSNGGPFSRERGLEMTTRSEFGSKFAGLVMAIAVLLGFALPARVSAQMVGATISGTIVDATGAVVPNVRIVVKNVSTGNVANAATNGVGVFNAPNLP